MVSATNIVLLNLDSVSSDENVEPGDKTEATADKEATDKETVIGKSTNKDKMNKAMSSKVEYKGTFGPVLISDTLAKGDHSTDGLGNIGYTLGATHEQHRMWAAQPIGTYDNNWMEIIGAADDILDKSRFVTKIKLDHMASHGGIKVGDELVHIGELKERKGSTVEKYGRVSPSYLIRGS